MPLAPLALFSPSRRRIVHLEPVEGSPRTDWGSHSLPSATAEGASELFRGPLAVVPRHLAHCREAGRAATSAPPPNASRPLPCLLKPVLSLSKESRPKPPALAGRAASPIYEEWHTMAQNGTLCWPISLVDPCDLRVSAPCHSRLFSSILVIPMRQARHSRAQTREPMPLALPRGRVSTTPSLPPRGDGTRERAGDSPLPLATDPWFAPDTRPLPACALRAAMVRGWT